MRFTDDGESFGVEATRTDVELARTAKDGLEVASDLLGTLGVTTDGDCFECDEKARLRPLIKVNDDGSRSKIHVCSGCQERKVDEAFAELQRQQAAAQQEQQQPAPQERIAPEPEESPPDVGEIDPEEIGGEDA